MTRMPADLGDRIKRLRLQQGLTLADLSERSGVPVSTLSKIENAQVRSTSADNLFKIARGLSVLFDHLIADPVTQQAANSRFTVTRRNETERYSTEIYNYFAHSGALLKKRMVPLLMHVKTRAVPAPHDWSHHPGEEWVFVVKGAVELHTEHYASVRLEQGDSAYFDCAMRHCYVTVSKEKAIILSVSLADDRPEFETRFEHPSSEERKLETDNTALA